MMSFPYQIHNGRPYPVLSLELSHLGKAMACDALVDSCADFNLFRAEFADFLGIPVERGEKIMLKGVGGEIACYRHLLTFRFADRVFQWPVYFSRQFRLPINLLGRHGFFEPFEVTFKEKVNLLILADAPVKSD